MNQLDLRDPKLWDGVPSSDMWKRFRETIAERGSALARGTELRPQDIDRRNESDRRNGVESERL